MANTKLFLPGITRLEDARYASAMGVDHIGFDLSPTLARHLPPADAKEMADWIIGTEPIGIFADDSVDQIFSTAKEVGCSWVQLSHPRPESSVQIKDLGLNVVASFSMHHDASPEQILALLHPFRASVDVFRIDTSTTSLWGEGMESMNWRVLREVASQINMLLAGSFTIDEALEAADLVRPYALELLDTIEESPGVKDFDKMGAFFDSWRARSAT